MKRGLVRLSAYFGMAVKGGEPSSRPIACGPHRVDALLHFWRCALQATV